MERHPQKPGKPLKKMRYHHGDLRNAIIDSVARLIEEKRSLAFQLKEVAKLVGTSQPAIYRHFENKDALLVETAVRGYQLQRELREHAIKTTGGTPLADILAILEAYTLFSITRSGYFLLIKNLETNEILASSTYLEERSRSIKRITDLLQDCIENGLLAETDLEIAHTVLQSSAYGLAHLYITGQVELITRPDVDNSVLSTRIFTLSLGSLLSEKGKAEFAKIIKNRNPMDFAKLADGKILSDIEDEVRLR